MDTQTPPPQQIPLWEQFERLIDLHTFYFEHIIKAAGFSFGIIGAVLVYVINSGLGIRGNHVWVALGIPILLSFGTFVVAVIGVVKTRDLAQKVREVQDALRLSWRPHAEVLPWMTGIVAVLFLIATLGLVVVSIEPGFLPSPPQKGH